MSTPTEMQPHGASRMNNGVGDAKAVDSKSVVPAQQVPNRVGPRPQRFFKPYVKDDRDEEKRDKHYQQGRRKKFVKKVPKVYVESATWLEHVIILRKAGVDVYEEERRTNRKLR